MLTILVKAVTLVAIIGIGYGIKRLGWVSAKDFPIFSNIVLKVTLPCALATSFNTITITAQLMYLVVVGVAVNLALQTIGYLRNRRRSRTDQAFAVLNLPSFNMGAFATPYISGFLGPAAMVSASMFDIGSSFQTAGVGYAWGTSLGDADHRMTPRSFVRQIFRSVVFDVYLGLLILRLLHLDLPGPVLQFTQTVGAANPFLAMLMIGIGLEIRLEPSKYLVAAKHLAVRYVVCLFFAVACWYALPVDRDIRVVLVMALFAPLAAMTAGFTLEAGADVELSSFLTSVSILVSVVLLPVIAATLTGPTLTGGA